MRIALNALTLPANLAGIGYYTRMLTLALAENPEIQSITIFTNSTAAASLTPLPEKVRIKHFPVKSILGKVAISQVILPFFLWRFEVVHSVGNVAILFSRKRQVVTIHDLCHKVLPARFGLLKRIYLGLGISLSCRKPITILCDSMNTMRDLQSHYPSARGKSRVVHLACKFVISREPESTERGNFLAVGTLEPGKNLELAIRALHRLKEKYGIAQNLDIVGAKGWKQSHLAPLIAHLGMEKHVTFKGYLSDDELRLLYRQAAALIYPSLYEGFGFPILEAQSQGCPVISAANSSLTEIGGSGCLYFENGDLDGLTDLMSRCHRGSLEFSAIVDKGYRNCARFSWEGTARETLSAYRQ